MGLCRVSGKLSDNRILFFMAFNKVISFIIIIFKIMAAENYTIFFITHSNFDSDWGVITYI